MNAFWSVVRGGPGAVANGAKYAQPVQSGWGEERGRETERTVCCALL